MQATLSPWRCSMVRISEEIALHQGYVDRDQVLAIARPIAKSDYGRYLLRITEGDL